MAADERKARVLLEMNAGLQDWWQAVRKQSVGYFKAGEFLPLPAQGNEKTSFHSSCERLYVREVFDGLFKDLCNILTVKLRLCHLNGNSGVGKSAFLWYFIIRLGIEQPNVLIVYESEAHVWEFHGGAAEVKYKRDYPEAGVVADEINFHLIDQKVGPGRPIGVRAIVAASPVDANTKAARRLRMTFTRYVPAWDKLEYDALVNSWRQRAERLPEDSEERIETLQRLGAAQLAYDWFGGIPRLIWAWEPQRLTEEEFASEINRCLANTKLENLLRAVLQESVSWRLFHFKLEPGDFSTFHYNFCSDKVADVYARYLVLENLDHLRAFIEASEAVPEYAALRGFVFEQHVIGLALRTNLMGMTVVDDVYCHTCNKKEDRGKKSMVNWIECSFCQQWYHTRCARANIPVDVRGVYRCPACQGPQHQQIGISAGGLLLRYYDGDLEDALIAAGSDAVKCLWRPLKKNNAVFDFVLPPRTLGQITIASSRHPSSIDALAKAVKALNAWRALFDPSSKEKDVLLLYLLPPSSFLEFGFQQCRQSGKVAQRAVKGLVQCKVALPVNGTPYEGLNLKPENMAAQELNLAEDLDSWEKALECKQDTSWSETAFVSLDKEKDRHMQQNCVYDTSEFQEFLLSARFETYKHPQLQALCKQLNIPANTTVAQMASDLYTYVKNLEVSVADDLETCMDELAQSK